MEGFKKVSKKVPPRNFYKIINKREKKNNQFGCVSGENPNKEKKK